MINAALLRISIVLVVLSTSFVRTLGHGSSTFTRRDARSGRESDAGGGVKVRCDRERDATSDARVKRVVGF